MTTKNQQLLTSLKRHPVKIPQWRNKPNEWITKLPNATAGKLGEKFVELALKAQASPKGSTFDLIYVPPSAPKTVERLEVKLCRKSYAGSNVWGWKQIRPQDQWDWMCLIAVDPVDTFLFVVPKASLLQRGRLSNQHGKKNKAGTLMQLVFPKFPVWLKEYEIK